LHSIIPFFVFHMIKPKQNTKTNYFEKQLVGAEFQKTQICQASLHYWTLLQCSWRKDITKPRIEQEKVKQRLFYRDGLCWSLVWYANTWSVMESAEGDTPSPLREGQHTQQTIWISLFKAFATQPQTISKKFNV